MKHLSKLWVILAIISLSVSCKEEEQNPSDSINTAEITMSRETEYGEDWIYFSFSQGAEVDGINDENYQTNSTWDIAFNRYNVRTNGGLSGVGEASTLDMGAVEFGSVTEAPESGYTVDSIISIVEVISHVGPPQMMDSNGNLIFTGVIMLEGQPPSYIPNDHIYVVKTVDGRYAKVWIKSFYNNQGESGYITIQYNFQEDGSRILE